MKRLLLENLRLKLFSLGIALILYLFIAYEAETAVEIDVPVKVLTDQDVTVVSGVPSTLQVTYRGPWASFRSFDKAGAEPVVLDLKDHAPGPISMSVQAKNLPSIPGMEAVKIVPSELNVKLDRLVERLVKVKADIRGKPAGGFTFGDIVVTPERVAIYGPARDVELVDYVFTKPVDLSGATKEVVTEEEVRPPTFPVRLKDSEARISLTIVVEEEYIKRYLEGIPVQLSDKLDGLRLKTRAISLSVRGPLLLMEKIAVKKIIATVNVGALENLSTGVLEVVPEIEGLPERTFLIGRSPTVLLEYRTPVAHPPRKK